MVKIHKRQTPHPKGVKPIFPVHAAYLRSSKPGKENSFFAMYDIWRPGIKLTAGIDFLQKPVTNAWQIEAETEVITRQISGMIHNKENVRNK